MRKVRRKWRSLAALICVSAVGLLGTCRWITQNSERKIFFG